MTLVNWTTKISSFLLLMVPVLGCHSAEAPQPRSEISRTMLSAQFNGTKPGEECQVLDIKFCWCPPGKFIMGSPPNEPERRPDETQVEVTLTKGFWIAKYETTQGQWKHALEKLPGLPTKELLADDDLPVGNVNFAEAENYCHRITELAEKAGTLPKNWEFRLPTEAQWEYAC